MKLMTIKILVRRVMYTYVTYKEVQLSHFGIGKVTWHLRGCAKLCGR